ncbi:helix-turn-helix domain-containing protein [Kutzneria sp. NPDC052558]|uniref:AraC-like ligand-binding domain-containing protein n=1 Tax=Kutzneria sp. NPDC052558 TaxID=3364121 RepID=UPI0037CA1FF4
MAETVSTDGLDGPEAADFWRTSMSETFVAVDIDSLADQPFRGGIELGWVGPMMVGRVRSTGQHIRRTQRLVNGAAAEYFQVGVVNSGVARVEQAGRQTILYPGDVVAYDTDRPFDWSFDRDWDVSVFTLPMGAMAAQVDERREFTARRADGRNPLTGLTSRFLLDLARTSTDAPPSLAERLTAHASDLLVTLFSGGLGESDATQGAAQRSLLARVKDHIDQHLADPRLGPQEIAAAANISLRYLHRIFEPEGRSVAQYVRELRLDRCRQDITSPAHIGRAIADIAFGHGFGDLSGFNRAFKARYGVRPSELRRAPLALAVEPPT